MTPLLVVLGAAVGAPARFLADRLIQEWHRTAVPWGTFAVNVLGSLLLGGLAAAVRGHGAPGWVLTLGGTGFCGAFTTFSTFGFETVRLLEERRLGLATAYAAGSLAVGLGACALAFWAVGSWVGGA